MRLMNYVFRKYQEKFVLLFIYYILVYYKNEEEHQEHLHLVLQKLREHQLYAKLSKCEFLKKEIEYFLHLISEEGLKVDPKKIEAISSWPTPKNAAEVISFLGLASYSRRFVQGFERIGLLALCQSCK